MNDTLTPVTLTSQMMNLYEQQSQWLTGQSGEILNQHRKKALDDFSRLGIPTQKNENYRYTPLENYFRGDYDNSYDNPFPVNVDDIFQCDVPELDTQVVLVHNGRYSPSNRPDVLPKGMVVCGLSEASVKYPELVEKHYGRYADTAIDGLVALNTLFTYDGVFIYLPPGTIMEKPLQVINLSHAFHNQRITRRNLIIAGENASANLVFCDHTLCNKQFLSNTLTEIFTGPNASINFNRLQNENSLSTQLNHLFAYQSADSHLTCNSISLHGGLIRNNFYVTMGGPRAEAFLNGLFLCDDSQHVANYILVDHASPHCTSSQLFKGILRDNATGSFNGKILVRKDAQKTQAYQKNNNMLLSDTSRMNTKPHLEIYADDVKCSHGATVGQIDKEAMFYLRSRGIGEDEARHLLMYAFANEIVSLITIPVLKTRIIDLVEKRLRNEIARCAECKANCG